MTNKALLKNLLPGLLPLFVFILADEIWGTKIGLYVALGFGIIELIFTYIKTKKIEKFILLDTGLLLTLGLISIALHNEIFFKLKPALIETILAAILAFSIYGPKNLIMAMGKRYMKNMQVNESAAKAMNKSLKTMLFITLLHIGLVIYSAYFMSKEAWAFISGGLFYILFLGYFGFEFLRSRRANSKYKNEEWLPIVNNEGKVTGAQPRSLCHDGSKKYMHPVVHLHVFNSKGDLYLQKRPMYKKVQPGKWDTAVGGHIAANETIETALFRETKEEIGLEIKEVKHAFRYIWESEIEKELVHSFILQTRDIPVVNKEEVADGKFWKLTEIEKRLETGLFTPNFEKEFKMLKQIIR